MDSYGNNGGLFSEFCRISPLCIKRFFLKFHIRHAKIQPTGKIFRKERNLIFMPDFCTCIISSISQKEKTISNHYRLIRTMDPFQHTDIFSVFLTTTTAEGTDEAFAYDITRNPHTAEIFFDLIRKGNVTALSLNEIAEDFIASQI
jgi:hypothetical protein